MKYLKLIDSNLFKRYKKIILKLFNIFGEDSFNFQKSKTEILIIWISKNKLLKILNFLKINHYNMLYDLHGIDERLRINIKEIPKKLDFTVFYHLLSVKNNCDLIVKVPISQKDMHIPTVTGIFLNANWYEREVWDMFGIIFDNHPNLTRILMPKSWTGHPLRKDYLGKATENNFINFSNSQQNKEIKDLVLNFQDFKINEFSKEKLMLLNLGPNHPSSHGVFRIVLKLEGEKIIDCIPDIGYHHRGAEKIGEYQSWHSYIPYTDRIEYLGGCINEMPYLLALEKLAKIKVPDKAKTIRIMLSELFRINSHLLYISTYIQDIGCMTPIFLAFTDRQKIYNLIEAITGARMHPAWFRIGGVANDLPKGWNKVLSEILRWLPQRLKKYTSISLKNKILIDRSKNIASYNFNEALSWGITGAGLRATGIDFDIRKYRPYSGYENFDFEIPIGNGISDCYNRVMIKLEEIYQSIRILEQCLKNMPIGPFKADHPLTTPPPKEKTLSHIDTLINHFLQVSWGTIMPANESFQMIEATKGINSYYILSDGGTTSYRTRIRTPSFAHLQQIPSVINGSLISDLIVYLGSIDFVMSDVDR